MLEFILLSLIIQWIFLLLIFWLEYGININGHLFMTNNQLTNKQIWLLIGVPFSIFFIKPKT